MICCLPACLSRAEFLRLPVALPKRRITSASVVPLPLYVGTLCCVAVGDVEFVVRSQVSECRRRTFYSIFWRNGPMLYITATRVDESGTWAATCV